MPLLIQENIYRHASWALWHINEPEHILLKALAPAAGELEELSGFKYEVRRLEWIASRLLIKQLAQAQQIKQLEILKDAFGKPHLTGASASISLSHSFPYAAAIINCQKEVGIDIEHAREKLLRVRHKFLNEEELSFAGDHLQKLCIYWTAKEAIYKMYGRRGLIFQENILVKPFDLKERGSIEALLTTKDVKQWYTLHYRCFSDLHICFSL